MENELISPQQAAKILSVSTDTLRKWEQKAKITAIKTIGGHRRYSTKEIIAIKNHGNIS